MHFIYEALVQDYRRQAKEKYSRLQHDHTAGVLGNRNRNKPTTVATKLKQPEQKMVTRANHHPKERANEETKQKKQAIVTLTPAVTIVKEDDRPIVPVRAREVPQQATQNNPIAQHAVLRQGQHQPFKQVEPNIERPIPTLNKPATANSKPTELPEAEPDSEPQLFECPEGCGRSFNRKALEKHAKVCKKVFQEKRKEFVAAEQRQIQQAKEISHLPISKEISKADAKQKWKQESLAFRANMKKNKGIPLTEQEQQALKQPAPDTVQCQFCSRRFNKVAAQKHIPFCERKSKKR